MIPIENLYYSSAKVSEVHFKVISSGRGIRKIFLNQKDAAYPQVNLTRLHPDDPYMFGIFKQIYEYFSLERKEFSLPFDIVGTEFQKKVWMEVSTIPYGETASYKYIAGKIKKPGSVRAVGQANSVNPLPVIIPCHRIIGADGSLTGYSGGLELKEHLLQLEGIISLELFNILRDNHIDIIHDY
jgi:methylated-DNA-[protein]-cysteine S-methyltransferase